VLSSPLENINYSFSQGGGGSIYLYGKGESKSGKKEVYLKKWIFQKYQEGTRDLK